MAYPVLLMHVLSLEKHKNELASGMPPFCELDILCEMLRDSSYLIYHTTPPQHEVASFRWRCLRRSRGYWPDMVRVIFVSSTFLLNMMLQVQQTLYGKPARGLTGR